MTTTYPKLTARKPVGGFIFLTVQQLCLLWWAYRTRLIQLRDLRVWFAAHEMVARRCQIEKSQTPEYTPRELHGLVGGEGGEHLRASLRRLEALGLLTWSSTTLAFATSPTDLRGVQNLSGFAAILPAIPNHHRRVPVPRQAVRLIAGGCRATVIATMLGHFIRCLYYKDHHCLSGGWCKASWIAEVFRLDLRSIKAARKHLVDIGWLRTFHTPQLLCNRWGTYTLISLSWTRATVEKAEENPALAPSLQAGASAETPPTGSPPPPDLSTTKLPPPSKKHIQPLQDLQHQKPAQTADPLPPQAPPQHTEPTSGGPTSGVQKQEKKNTKTPTTQAPTLRHIVLDDLRNTDRLLALFEQAHGQGLIGKSDSQRLTFLATAEHARVIGSTNPCGLLAELIRRQLWHYVTESDEDAAYKRLKQHLYGRPKAPAIRAMPEVPAPQELSQDACLVQLVRADLARGGYRHLSDDSIFALVRSERSDWTRERWDAAVLDLENAKRAWKRANDLNRMGTVTSVEECLASVFSAAD